MDDKKPPRRLGLTRIGLVWAVLACLLGVAAPGGARAQDDAAGADVALTPMTVTARGVPRPTSLTPGSVGVIEADEIAETAPLGLADAAARLAGVDVSDDSPYGADISIRGLGRDSVVFLIDGCRVNMTTDLNGRFGLVNPMDVERIEVIKGPASVLYGSGSTGGVVNIITKKGRFEKDAAWHGETMATGSTNPQGGDLYGNLSYNSDRAWFLGSGSWREADDYRSGGGDRVSNSKFSDWSGKLAAGWAWSDTQSTMLQYQHTEGDGIGIPGKGTANVPVGAELTLEDNDRQFLQMEHSFKPEDSVLAESTLQLSYQKIERNPRIDKFAAGNYYLKPEAQYETQALNWKNVFELGSHTLVAGVDAWNWHYMHSTRVRKTLAGAVFTDTPTPNTDQTSAGIYVEDDWALAEAWILNLGLRGDGVFMDNESTRTIEAGSHESLDWGGHVGLTWIFAPDWSMTGLVAASYRSPNILERFKNINLGGGKAEIGNPDLRSERSTFWEYGLHLADQTLRWDSSVFLNQVEDYIGSTAVSPTVYQMGNVARARLWGVDSSVDWRFAEAWSAYGNIAYTEGFDDKTGEPLRFVAPLGGLLGLRQEL
ncbi:MAG: TonB-dependent receptor plug domain-containing protein, partial [Desulfovibrionaceae bacterium]